MKASSAWLTTSTGAAPARRIAQQRVQRANRLTARGHRQQPCTRQLALQRRPDPRQRQGRLATARAAYQGQETLAAQPAGQPRGQRFTAEEKAAVLRPEGRQTAERAAVVVRRRRLAKCQGAEVQVQHLQAQRVQIGQGLAALGAGGGRELGRVHARDRSQGCSQPVEARDKHG